MFSIPFQCRRSMIISKTKAELMSVVGDFRQWQHWSPWLCMEKDCPVSIEGLPQQPQHRQSWDGKRIGSGRMIMTSQTDSTLHYELAFLKPWKSKSQVELLFDEQGTGTEVTWVMNGRLPVFMFFMKKRMKAWVESDFDRGLLMLKDYLEMGQVNTDTEVQGIQSKAGFYYLGIEAESSIAEMPEMMSKDFERLAALVKSGELPEPNDVLSFYHTYDLVNARCQFTSAFAYQKRLDNQTPENSAFKDLSLGQIPEHKSLQVHHRGSYKHLGNAWGAVMAEQRAQKIKMNKSIAWYERYLNSPVETAEADLQTEINIPVKGK